MFHFEQDVVVDEFADGEAAAFGEDFFGAVGGWARRELKRGGGRSGDRNLTQVSGFPSVYKNKMRRFAPDARVSDAPRISRLAKPVQNLEFGPSPDASKTMRRPLPVRERLGASLRGDPSTPRTPLRMTQGLEEAYRLVASLCRGEAIAEQ